MLGLVAKIVKFILDSDIHDDIKHLAFLYFCYGLLFLVFKPWFYFFSWAPYIGLNLKALPNLEDPNLIGLFILKLAPWLVLCQGFFYWLLIKGEEARAYVGRVEKISLFCRRTIVHDICFFVILSKQYEFFFDTLSLLEKYLFVWGIGTAVLVSKFFSLSKSKSDTPIPD